MHEYHIVESIVRQVVETAKKNNAARVSKVNLALSEFSDLEESSIRLYFEQISEGTCAEGAAVAIKTVKSGRPPSFAPKLYIVDIEVEKKEEEK